MEERKGSSRNCLLSHGADRLSLFRASLLIPLLFSVLSPASQPARVFFSPPPDVLSALLRLPTSQWIIKIVCFPRDGFSSLQMSVGYKKQDWCPLLTKFLGPNQMIASLNLYPYASEHKLEGKFAVYLVSNSQWVKACTGDWWQHCVPSLAPLAVAMKTLLFTLGQNHAVRPGCFLQSPRSSIHSFNVETLQVLERDWVHVINLHRDLDHSLP